ncbi:MAG: Ldh family oxidoreductase [Tissierellia bacterium]|nr:Ldh family oxidoreductase [Tissierellia bacterium]
MGYYRIDYKKLKGFCETSFIKVGFTEDDSRIISDVILLSDLYGIESHGLQRLKMYHDDIKSGMVNLDSKAEVIFETPVSGVIDAHFCIGHLAAYRGMSLAIGKAKKTGIGITTVRDSNHFGIAGYYSKMACDRGLLGLSFTNSGALMVPTNGILPMIGSNPIACAMPAEPYDFLFDASTTVVTHGKLEVYKKLGKPLPNGWAIDQNGDSSTDAAIVIENIKTERGGGILPLGGATETLGGHKGYGYGMLTEIFSSIISLGMTSNYCLKDNVDGCCHGFIAIDPNMFGDAKQIKNHLSRFLQELRESPKAQNQDHIYTHGEKEIRAMEDRLAYGIMINENTMSELNDLCDELDIDFKDCLANKAQ